MEVCLFMEKREKRGELSRETQTNEAPANGYQ